MFVWTLNDPIAISFNLGNRFFFSNPASSDDQLYDHLKRHFNHEFEESSTNNQKIMSVKDRRALAFLESIQLQYGH